VTANFPNFNRLLVTLALYNLILGKLTNMGHVIPSRNSTLVQTRIFTEQVPCTDRHVLSESSKIQDVEVTIVQGVGWMV
jgi:hypothetical protein